VLKYGVDRSFYIARWQMKLPRHKSFNKVRFSHRHNPVNRIVSVPSQY